ncbi:hypothetical protein RB195_000342 [Necator americanus]|uniref:Uncharacterized protein n=1 Tax=Necator americanus TaxID=51031 RepID=A0ABR1D9B8_NECAM
MRPPLESPQLNSAARRANTRTNHERTRKRNGGGKPAGRRGSRPEEDESVTNPTSEPRRQTKLLRQRCPRRAATTIPRGKTRKTTPQGFRQRMFV